MANTMIYLKYRLKWAIHIFAKKAAQKLGVELNKPEIYCKNPVLSLEDGHAYIKKKVLVKKLGPSPNY